MCRARLHFAEHLTSDVVTPLKAEGKRKEEARSKVRTMPLWCQR